ncbi:MAG: hypothetical protein R6U01_03175 [Halorubrum sp.]|uniref:hypothetical protein n=1 Tax=Halorubrum sp. TaxID=1879286 RepID=UPI0039710873
MGFEPKSDVLARTARCARLIGFESPYRHCSLRSQMTSTMGLPRATEESEWEYIVLVND